MKTSEIGKYGRLILGALPAGSETILNNRTTSGAAAPTAPHANRHQDQYSASTLAVERPQILQNLLSLRQGIPHNRAGWSLDISVGFTPEGPEGRAVGIRHH